MTTGSHVLILCAFITLFLFLARPAVMGSPYGYDEADYMYATKLGLVANYTDTPTMPMVEFLKTGLGRGQDSGQASVLSGTIRKANDIVFYRHWHGPLYFYWLLLMSHLRLDEHGMRSLMLVFPICSLLLIYFGCLWLFPGTQGRLAAVLGPALFLWSVPAVRSTELAPHQVFVCCALSSLILVSKTVATGNRLYFYLAVVAAAFDCCLLEVGFVAVTTLFVCGYVERRRLRADWAFAARSFLLFVATVIVAWPGAIQKLSLLKGYLFMTYLALFRTLPFGSEGFTETWQMRFRSSPVEWLVIGASLLLWVYSRNFEGNRRLLYPFGLYAVLMLATTLRVTSGFTRYTLLFQPALDVLAGCTLAAHFVRFQRAAACGVTAMLSVALFAATWFDLRRRPVIPNPRPAALLSYVRANHLDRNRLFVPQADVPMLHYYFPDARLRAYAGRVPEPGPGDADVDGVLYSDYPIRYEPISRPGN